MNSVVIFTKAELTSRKNVLLGIEERFLMAKEGSSQKLQELKTEATQ